MAPNSYRFVRAFLRACDRTGMALFCELLCSCFRLSRGSSSYYLSHSAGFIISGANSCAKGWRGQYFVVDGDGDWGFLVAWGAHIVDNALPSLYVVEAKSLEKIRELFASGAIER